MFIKQILNKLFSIENMFSKLENHFLFSRTITKQALIDFYFQNFSGKFLLK